MTKPEDKNMDELVALCKRRGFVYPASEIYGGLRGFWDYGPLGTALKNNIRDWWWRCMVDCPPIGPDGEPVSMMKSNCQHVPTTPFNKKLFFPIGPAMYPRRNNAFL